MADERILLVADDAFEGAPEDILLWKVDFITSARAVHVIAPELESRIEWATNADAPLRAAAERLRIVLAHASTVGVDATGEVAPDSPFDAVRTELMHHTYDRILVAVREDMNWQEKDLVSKIRSMTDIPVDAVVVPTPKPKFRDPRAVGSPRR
jgi:hypothetical protein